MKVKISIKIKEKFFWGIWFFTTFPWFSGQGNWRQNKQTLLHTGMMTFSVNVSYFSILNNNQL